MNVGTAIVLAAIGSTLVSDARGPNGLMLERRVLGRMCLGWQTRAPDPFEQALVSSEGLDATRFDDSVRLRLPDVELRRSWDLEADPLGRFLFVHVSNHDGVLGVEVITADGRAFVRRVPSGDEPERLAASFVVSLVSSIELEEVRADRDDVDAPTTPQPEDIENAVDEARGEAEAKAEPEPEQEPESIEPESMPEPEVREVEVLAPWSLDVMPAVGIVLGLAPADFDTALAGGGGALSLLGRSPRNVLVGGSLRALGRRSGDHGLVRVRVGATVGYAWSLRRIELLAGGTVGLGNWSIRSNGERISGPDLGAQSLLVSLGGWVSGGPVFAVNRPRLRAVRVGAHVELGGGFVLENGARAVAIFDEDGADLFRVGGLELSTGLDVTFSFRWSDNR